MAGLCDSTLSASELVAQSGTGDINPGPDVAIVNAEVKEYGVVGGVNDLPEVVVQPFATQEPVIPKHPLDSDTCHPAEHVKVGGCVFFEKQNSPVETRRGCSDALMAPTNASRSVEEHIGNYQVAEPSTNGS